MDRDKAFKVFSIIMTHTIYKFLPRSVPINEVCYWHPLLKLLKNEVCYWHPLLKLLMPHSSASETFLCVMSQVLWCVFIIDVTYKVLRANCRLFLSFV